METEQAAASLMLRARTSLRNRTGVLTENLEGSSAKDDAACRQLHRTPDDARGMRRRRSY